MGQPAFSFNEKVFRAAFSAFAKNTDYPTELLQMYYEAAGQFIANTNYGPLAQCGGTAFALNLMTAHLVQIGNQIAQGIDSGINVQATIDKISTTIYAFAYPNQWQVWLGSTEYGKQLLAFLQVKSVGGWSVPGSIGRAGFRRI